jgi:hypothetical protein
MQKTWVYGSGLRVFDSERGVAVLGDSVTTLKCAGFQSLGLGVQCSGFRV